VDHDLRLRGPSEEELVAAEEEPALELSSLRAREARDVGELAAEDALDVGDRLARRLVAVLAALLEEARDHLLQALGAVGRVEVDRVERRVEDLLRVLARRAAAEGQHARHELV